MVRASRRPLRGLLSMRPVCEFHEPPHPGKHSRMSRPIAPSSEILDAVSRQSIKRFLLTLALFVLWAQVPSSYSAAHALSLMAACAAGIDAAIALLAREPFLNATL